MAGTTGTTQTRTRSPRPSGAPKPGSAAAKKAAAAAEAGNATEGGSLQQALEASLEAANTEPGKVIEIGSGGRSSTGDNRTGKAAGKSGTAAKGSAAKTPPAKANPADSDSSAPAAAKIDVGSRQVEVWFPYALVPKADGTKGSERLHCPHTKYGHETEAAARKCIAHTVRSAGYTVPAAKAS